MHVLLVEDEIKLARGIAHMLSAHGYTVETAYDGVEACEKALCARFDVILLDWMLPKKNGLEVVHDLRVNGLTVPILLLTAKDAVHDRVNGLDSGADDYLVKPFATEELLARVRALIRRNEIRHEAPGAVIRSGEIQIDTVSHEVYVSGEVIQLTHKEYQLLLLFMQHPRQVLTKELILERVWGYESNAVPNAVEIYVHYLRKKLGSASRGIKTVRGVGYRFEEAP